jgi:hypothetical protein
MVLKITPQFDDEDDDDELQLQPPVQQPTPQPKPEPQPPKPQYRQPEPSSAPAVPKELLSARPAMTRVVPRSPEKMAQIQAAQQAAQNKPATPPPPSPKEIAERKNRIDYLRNLRESDRKPKKKKGGKKWLAVLLVLLLLGGLAGGGYWYTTRKVATPVTKTATGTSQQPGQQAAPVTPQQPVTASLKDYQSTNFSVSLKYPSDWTVSDTKPKLTITSTKQTFTNAAGKQVSGQVVVMIRPKQASLPEFKAGPAAAVLDSKKVNYTQPAAGQRGSTYLSYLQYASTTTKGALDAIYVTGNSGYTKAQTVPQADVVRVDPLIDVYFAECPNDTCAATDAATSVESAAWSASELNKTVEAILTSLAIS